jgi:hypothetical protein
MCIDATRGPGSELFDHWVEEGEIYTVRRIEGSLTGDKRVLLKEIKNPKIFVTALQGYAEPGFSLKRFIELEDDHHIHEHTSNHDAVLS